MTQDKRPDTTPEPHVEKALEGTFPASDPTQTASTGPRAVAAHEMMPTGQPLTTDNPVIAHFSGAEEAGLAEEHLVRGVPLDRSRVEKAADANGHKLIIHTTEADRARVEDLLRPLSQRR